MMLRHPTTGRAVKHGRKSSTVQNVQLRTDQSKTPYLPTFGSGPAGRGAPKGKIPKVRK